MTTPILARPGIAAATVINGTIVFNRGAGTFQPLFDTAETRNRVKSAKLVTHRLYPHDGAPDRTRKGRIQLRWPSLQSGDIDFVNGLIAWGGPMTIVPWVVITESFWCAAGTPASGVLSRLDAATTLTPPAEPDYFRARYGTSPQANDGWVTLGAPDTVNNRTPWSVPSYTPGVGMRVWVAHSPVFVVQIGEDQVEFPSASQQGYSLTFEEC